MAGAPGIDPLLSGAVVFLGASVVAVPIFKRLGLGSVLGYLAAGTLIGPHVLGLVSDVDGVRSAAEFGVVLLLFVIGLELQPRRLWRLRLEIFGLGLAQVVATSILLATSMWLTAPISLPAAIALGAALALSSTAFAVQLMRDRGELTTRHGDRAFAILLFQDLAIVPLLAMTSFLGSTGADESTTPWQDVGIGLGAVAALLVIGRYGLPPLFRIIALTRTDEIFTAAALLVVATAAMAMQAAGLSMALGAFLAGVLLAESEFRHQLEADIEPFRSLFLGLFFMSVGMAVVWGVVAEWWWLVLLGALILYAGKAVFLVLLTMATGSSRVEAIRISALLGQGGEFGFVILGLGTATGLWDAEVATVISGIIVLTMVMTPLAIKLADRLTHEPAGMDGIDRVEDVEETAPVIVAGFGRFGQVVARILKLRGYDVILIDNDPERIRIAETFGNKVFFGDLRRSDVLHMAAAGEARAIFLCGDDSKAIAKALEKLRARLPGTPIFCRASDRFEQTRLEKLGAAGVVRETFESAVVLSRMALESLGDAQAADELIEEFRKRDLQLLALQEQYGVRGGYERMREDFSLEKER
ncbi:MAG: monovalent cation:proton antiporter-2 (CPA2) family protein [Pseudomonadota bacterium]